MKLHVHKPDGAVDVFGDVMGIQFAADSGFLDVGYQIGSESCSKSYGSGQWFTAVMDATETDYNLPTKPVP